MALRDGLDTVAILTLGSYTETYKGAGNQARINNLYASLGFLEIAPNISAGLLTLFMNYYRRLRNA